MKNLPIGLWVPALCVAAFLLCVVFNPEFAPKSAAAADEPATRFITVGGTGTLQEENGKFFVRGTGQTEVALGIVDGQTLVDGPFFYRDRNHRDTPVQEYYLNHYVTVIAVVEVATDNESVFRPIRTARLTIFRHSDGLPGLTAQ